MILKIRNEVNFDSGLDLPGWYYFDKIINIKVDHFIYNKDELGITDRTTDYTIGETLKDHIEKNMIFERFFSTQRKNKYLSAIQIIVTFENGSEETWVSRAETYLLNDSGKTIEKLFS